MYLWVPGTPSVFFVLLIGNEELGAPNPISAHSDSFSKMAVCSEPRPAP